MFSILQKKIYLPWETVQRMELGFRLRLIMDFAWDLRKIVMNTFMGEGRDDLGELEEE